MMPPSRHMKANPSHKIFATGKNASINIDESSGDINNRKTGMGKGNSSAHGTPE